MTATQHGFGCELAAKEKKERLYAGEGQSRSESRKGPHGKLTRVGQSGNKAPVRGSRQKSGQG